MGRLWLLVAPLLIGAQPPKLVRTPKRPAVVDASTHETVKNATADARRRLATRGGGRTDVYRPAPGNIYTFAPTASQTQEPTRDMERMPPPLLMPPSGAYDLAVGASLLHEIPGTQLHCTIEGVDCPLSPTGDECAPTRASPSYMAGTIIHLSGTMSPTVTLRCMARAPMVDPPEYSRKDPEQQLRDSEPRARTYEVQMGMYDYDRRGYTGRVGMAYLVPYYRGMNYADEAGLTMPALSGHSSDMASVDLNTSSYLSVRIHGVDTDFADFYTIDIVNDLPYSRGTGAYKVSYCVLEGGVQGDACSLAFPCKNGEPCETVGRQANKHDLAKYADNDKLKGFFHGFVQHQKRRFTTETFHTDYKYYRRYMVSYKEILEAVKYGEKWYRDAGRFNSYARREPSFQAADSYPDGMGGWAEVPEAESRAPMDLDNNVGPVYFADGGSTGTPGSPPGKEWRYDFEIEAPGSNGIFLVPLEAPQPMQDIAPWTVCDARIREDPTKKVTNISKHNSTSYGFLAPFFDGHRYSGSTVRLKLATTMQEVQVTRTWINIMTCCVVNITREICALNRTEVRDSGAVRITTIDEYATASIEVNNTATATNTTETEIPKTINVPAAPSRTEALDLTQTHDRLRGFVGGFAMRDHIYFVPHFDGRNPGHVIARLEAEDFSQATVKALDLWHWDKTLAGYFGGFGYTTQGPDHAAGVEYGFLVPHAALTGPVGKVNSQHPADTWAPGVGQDWNLDYSDERDTSTRLGERHWYEEGGSFHSEQRTQGSQRTAVGGDHTTEYFHGKLVRLHLADFESTGDAPFDVLDLTEIDPDLRGFAGGSVVGRYGLLVPYKNRVGDDGFFGKLVKVDLEAFVVEAVLDLTRLEINSKTTEISGDALRGFVGGVSFGKYFCLVPHRNNRRDINYNKRDHSALVVRIDVDDFTISTGVKVVDLSKVVRQQIPSQPDNELRGFLHGFAAGEYLYLAPHFGRDFHGKLVRIDMRDFATLADLQAADQSTDVPVGTVGAYTGVQYVDLERSDPNLVGFSGGFSVRSSEPMVEKPLDSPEKRSEWWEQCHYVPLADGEAASSSSSRVAHVTRREFFANRYCSDEPVTRFDGGKAESLYVIMRECLESRVDTGGFSGIYEEPYCYTNFRIPLDSDRLPGCLRATDAQCYFENEPYTYLTVNDQKELDRIELDHRETCSDFHDEIGLEHFSTSETGIALNEATPGLVEITPEGDDYAATFPRVVL
jgi:hypothetical protein